MRVLFVIALAILQSKTAVGSLPTYDELKAQLQPVELTPGGKDQYFFFIVPVQKNDEPKVLLQMAQAHDKTDFTNKTVAATKVDTQDSSVYAAEGEDINLDDVFDTPEDNGTDDFNFQVPVIVPLDFRFTYDPSTASETLPQCEVDSRTWKEKVISRIAEKLELEGEYTWDHTDLTVRIRLRKDALTSISQEEILTMVQLNLYVNTLINTKTLADMRYTALLEETTTITGGHVSIAAEGVDTYRLVKDCIIIANAAKTTVTGGDAVTVDLVTAQLESISDSTNTNLDLFREFLRQAKELQNLEAE